MERETIEIIADENAINTVHHYDPPDNHEAQIWRNELVENAKTMPETNWRDEVKLSDD